MNKQALTLIVAASCCRRHRLLECKRQQQRIRRLVGGTHQHRQQQHLRRRLVRLQQRGQRKRVPWLQRGPSEIGSNRLYIDNCYTGGSCTSPFIYGDFANNVLDFNAYTSVWGAAGASKSQLHFSSNVGGDTGGYLTSVLDNNFFMSSGARYDGTLAAPKRNRGSAQNG
jgi:hypothetical protein